MSQAGTASKFEHKALPGADRGEEVHDSWSTYGSVGTEAPVMHGRQVLPVVRSASIHPAMLA
jgi:hypothetical protein